MVNYFGYDVVLTMNITDIDDKIMAKSAAEGIEFNTLARREEASFLADMEKLGVLPPDVMTRVSEYIPEIIDFVQRLVKNGYAYESNGSVYFNVPEYRKSKLHTYGKLVPENVGNKLALDEGEGVSAGTSDKRDGSDFALWKAFKGAPGEPSWDSPWGKGRPGWHIECSAMCDGTLSPFAKGQIDIHSGGIDLRFPHHDNEIAQSEACLDCPQWINYFLHSGHLHIEGLKMSKSLKNFIKISDALEKYGPRQLRMFFLMTKYNAPMHYSQQHMEMMSGVERTYIEFFDNVKARLRSLPPTVNQHWNETDRNFATMLSKVKEDVRKALADDFNTPLVMSLLNELVGATNKYMGTGNQQQPVPLILKAGGDYVSYMFRIFGLIDAVPPIGGNVSSSSSSGGDGSLETTLTPYLNLLAEFRVQVKELSRKGDTTGLLKLCDNLRDEVLPTVGVKLEDTVNNGVAGSAWKLRSPEELKKEADEKKAAAEEKARRKAELAAEAARKQAEKEAKLKIDPRTMFINQTDKYSKFDDKGIPTHDAAGQEVSKSGRKNLEKEWNNQDKLYTEYVTKQNNNNNANSNSSSSTSTEGNQ